MCVSCGGCRSGRIGILSASVAHVCRSLARRFLALALASRPRCNKPSTAKPQHPLAHCRSLAQSLMSAPSSRSLSPMPAIHSPALEDVPASPAIIPNSAVPSAAFLPSLVVPFVPPVTSSPSGEESMSSRPAPDPPPATGAVQPQVHRVGPAARSASSPRRTIRPHATPRQQPPPYRTPPSPPPRLRPRHHHPPMQ